MAFDRTELASGIRVLTERIAGVRSVGVGAWVGAGSRDEPPELNGATHFLEHMLFKGTATRSARDIAESFDAVGGDLNAFTTREYTCFHARTLDVDLPMAVEVVADMLRSSTLSAEDLEAERQVLLQEISMHEDTPDDFVHDQFLAAILGDHPLGRPVQGTAATVEAMARDAVEAFYRLHYRPGNLVVVAAGSLEHAAVVEAVEKAFAGEPPGLARPARSGAEAPPVRGAADVRGRDIEQTHIVYGTRGLSRTDPRRWALSVLHSAFGAGMSSRLFQEVREKRGLVYAIWSGPVSFAETGLFTVYAATSPDKAAEVLALVRDEVRDVLARGITEEELARGKGHLRGSLVLGLEDPGGRMWHLGKSELCHGEILSPDEVIERIEAVTLEEVRDSAREVLGGEPWALAVLGPEPAESLEEFAGPVGRGGGEA